MQAEQGEPDAILELEALPPLPPHGAHLWQWWIELHASRPNNGMGLSPLSRQEIRLWEEDEGRQLLMWERRAILSLDAEWLRITSQQSNKREAAKP